MGAGSCSTDGTCNGAGACRLYGQGTICVAAACMSTTTGTPARTCNGTGTCQTVTSTNCTPYVCATNACKTSCTADADCQSPNICLGSVCAPNPNLKVQYHCVDPGAPNDQAVRPHFKIFNGGSSPVSLQSLTIRYWYTIDTPVDAESSQCDFAQLGCNNVVLSNVTLSPVRTGSDRYFQVGFGATAGNLAANTDTGEIQIWFHKNSWGNYTEGSNDYSYDATKTTYMDWNRVTLYQNGTRVWGIEP
jgi:cellulose 1,4-beta-cellobiosidase